MRRENWYRVGLMWSVSAAVASAVGCNPDPRCREGARATVVTPEPMPSDARFREFSPRGLLFTLFRRAGAMAGAESTVLTLAT